MNNGACCIHNHFCIYHANDCSHEKFLEGGMEMIDKETYKKELMRMFASFRKDNNRFSYCLCRAEQCNDCPLSDCCHMHGTVRPYDVFEVIEKVEKWSKEHPQEKYKVSKLEYSILEAYMDLSNCGSVKMLDFPVFNRLHELGYFKGATTDTYTRDYFENCEVKEDV